MSTQKFWTRLAGASLLAISSAAWAMPMDIPAADGLSCAQSCLPANIKASGLSDIDWVIQFHGASTAPVSNATFGNGWGNWGGWGSNHGNGNGNGNGWGNHGWGNNGNGWGNNGNGWGWGHDNDDWDDDDDVGIPEPGPLALVGLGLILLSCRRKLLPAKR